MELFIILLLIAAGFVLIVFGGNMFVDSAIWMAEKAKVPKLLIGATIVSVGTTLPETMVSVIAAARGDAGLAVSNASGSMLANLSLILGIGLAVMPMLVKRRAYIGKFAFAGLNAVLLILFVIDGNIQLWESIILLVLFALFMALNIVEAMKQNKLAKAATMPVTVPEGEAVKARPGWLMILLFIVGAAGIGFGAEFLVESVKRLATDYLHIPTAIVGATVVAFGTSLPELVTAISSIRKKSLEMSVGNILGANIINGTFLIGISGALQGTAGMPVIGANGNLTIFLCFFALLAGLLILIPPILAKGKTYRWQGVALIILYAGYVAYVIASALI